MLTAAVMFGALGSAAFAQDMPPVLVLPAPAPKAAEAAQPVAIPAAQGLTEAQFDQLIAPIALYPDALLGQVLMASTYPLQVVEAARWLTVPANRALGGDGLTAALKNKHWDPSVMALAPFPDLLAIMADKLEWTEQLSAAFLTHETEVMAAVQRLRHAAMAAGNLKATPECHCVIQVSGDTIALLPADAGVVSIPVYNPTVAYGTWPAADYPPAAFPPPPGFAFAPGVVVGFDPAVEVALYGPLWGWSSVDWAHRRIVVDNARYAAIVPGHPGFPGGVWAHEAPHRRAVATTEPPVVLRPHPARPRRLALAHPPAPFMMPRHHGTGIPPGTIVPPPPPVHHAHYMPGSYFDRYR